MHCAEKTTMDLLPAMEVDMHAYVFVFLRDFTS